jgi:hypothetical protein
MRIQRPIGTILVTLISCGQGFGGVGGENVVPPRGHFLQRFHPVGGWHPYGGGLVHWWDPHCFPRQAAPDDYCRKPLPAVCWPAYPPYYIYGPPEITNPGNAGVRDCNKTH